MTLTICDGCGSPLHAGIANRACLEVNRVDGLGGAGIPTGQSHLCNDCAVVAFQALRDRQAARGRPVVGMPRAVLAVDKGFSSTEIP